MSEEIIQEAPPRQFLMMVNEVNMALISRVMPGITFLQVEGMNVSGNERSQVLVTPINAPLEVPEATIPEEFSPPEEVIVGAEGESQVIE